MSRASTSDDPNNLERFQAFLRPLAALALGFAVLYAAAATQTKSRDLAAVAGLLLAYSAVTRWARRLADAGNIALAAEVVAYALLALVLLGVFLLPFGYPSFMVGGLLSVAIALPYVAGRPLRVLLVAALAAIVVVGVRGFLARGHVPFPPWIRLLSQQGGAWAAAYLLLLLLWQFTERLGHTIHQTRRARLVAEAARERAAFLSEASRVLGASSLDYRVTLSAVARLAVPRLADYCVIDELESDGRLRRVEVVHDDPSKQHLLDRLLALEVRTAAHPAKQVMSTLQPLLIGEIDDALLRNVAQTEEHLAVLRDLEPSSTMVLPLVARGHALGSILLARTAGHRPYSTEDLELAKDLAYRAALATDNARLYTEAQAAIRTRDEFLSIASHELRTPLTPLELQIQVLRRHSAEIVGGALPGGWFEKRLNTIARQSDRLGRLVEDLLDISRIANGHLHLQRESVDLAELVREVAERLVAARDGANTSIELHVDAPEGIIGDWDRMRLDQVVTNLLSNALKYGAGSPVDVVAEVDGGEAVLTVTDRGIGIAVEDQERIFERFERAAPSANFGGLGLGLFIARQIVSSMGGRIEVRSEFGKGSSFAVRLPLQAPPEDRPEPTTHP